MGNKSTLVKVAKSQWKAALRNKELYSQRRDEMLRQIINSEVPVWGSLKIIVTKL